MNGDKFRQRRKHKFLTLTRLTRENNLIATSEKVLETFNFIPTHFILCLMLTFHSDFNAADQLIWRRRKKQISFHCNKDSMILDNGIFGPYSGMSIKQE